MTAEGQRFILTYRLETADKVALVGKATRQRNVSQRAMFLGHQRQGVLNPDGSDIVAQATVKVLGERAREMDRMNVYRLG